MTDKTEYNFILAKKDKFLQVFDEAQRQKVVEALQKYQTLSITNISLWEKLIQENLNAPKTDFVPLTFSKDATMRIDKMMLYAGILEGRRKETGTITLDTIDYADDIADLSFDFKKIHRGYLPAGCKNVRFDGLRFWADVILARTWKYGDELLKAEGFTNEDIEKIKTHPILPTKYTYWEALSHPYMRDVRVKEFWYGESPEKVADFNRALPYAGKCKREKE